MKISSSAGEMDMFVTSVQVKDNDLVMKGKMGVWDATILVTPEETSKIAWMVMKPSVILYVIKLPFRRLRRK